jgi:hypothetical protein
MNNNIGDGGGGVVVGRQLRYMDVRVGSVHNRGNQHY